MRSALKALAKGICVVLLLPCAILSAFGRVEPIYTIFAHACALLPGIVGDYARAAYYSMTLQHCALQTGIGFGTIFAHREALVARGVTIGAYCVLGRVRLGEGTLIASGVQVLSGSTQHVRDNEGRLRPGDFTEIAIGANCWIGANAVVMADVGAGATVAPGSVVYRPVPSGTTVAGNPARLVRGGRDSTPPAA